MCIRDRIRGKASHIPIALIEVVSVSYTHLTAADEGLGVDLGGRRIIKKNED